MGLPDDTPVTVVGPNDPTNPGVEANLDIQYIMGGSLLYYIILHYVIWYIVIALLLILLQMY